ncbi:MAG TPA: prepilin-type N-terminal cleavage/methylation domain-containing protein [Anaerolineales bacterium]|nr:prepilin-type N-terminal cleavage/methylation domain-containing protein [Anaerolineales bacterium]
MRGQRGNTLMEVLVGLSVFAAASLGIFAGFKASLTGWEVTQQFTSEQQSARATLEWVSRRVRMIGVGYTGTAPTVDTAQANEIRYWVGAECYRIYLSAGTIQQQTGAACGTGTSRPLASDRDAGQLTVTSLTFRYFNAATGGGGPGTAEMPAPVLGDDRYLIKRVEIGIAVQGTQGAFGLATQATVRNGR